MLLEDPYYASVQSTLYLEVIGRDLLEGERIALHALRVESCS
jgi:hypothetical protein